MVARIATAVLATALGSSQTHSATVTLAALGGSGPDTCLNRLLVDCANRWVTVFEAPVIRGAFQVLPDGGYRADLVRAATPRGHPFRVTYVIRARARWSDGVPVTARDFRFTWRTIMDPSLRDHV